MKVLRLNLKGLNICGDLTAGIFSEQKQYLKAANHLLTIFSFRFKF